MSKTSPIQIESSPSPSLSPKQPVAAHHSPLTSSPEHAVNAMQAANADAAAQRHATKLAQRQKMHEQYIKIQLLWNEALKEKDYDRVKLEERLLSQRYEHDALRAIHTQEQQYLQAENEYQTLSRKHHLISEINFVKRLIIEREKRRLPEEQRFLHSKGLATSPTSAYYTNYLNELLKQLDTLSPISYVAIPSARITDFTGINEPRLDPETRKRQREEGTEHNMQVKKKRLERYDLYTQIPVPLLPKSPPHRASSPYMPLHDVPELPEIAAASQPE